MNINALQKKGGGKNNYQVAIGAQTQPSNRIIYTDVMRGIMMLLVVFIHLLLFCIPKELCYASDNIILQGLQAIRMPSFFCISGFFAFGVYNISLFRKRLYNRITCQLWPTVILFLCYTLYSKNVLWDAIVDEYKGGYWFTYCMVLVWSLYAVASFFVTKFSIHRKVEYCIYITLVLTLMYLHVILNTPFETLNTSLFARLICLAHIRHLVPYFFIGVFLRMNYEAIERKLVNMTKLTGLIVVMFLLILFYLSMPFSLRVREFVGLFMVLMLFYNFRTFLSSDNQIVSYLRFIGQNTLPIYLIHYFVLITCSRLDVFNWVFSIFNARFLFLPILLLACLLISELCLFIYDLIKILPHLHKLIFGKDPKPNDCAIIMKGINIASLKCLKSLRLYSSKQI